MRFDQVASKDWLVVAWELFNAAFFELELLVIKGSGERESRDCGVLFLISSPWLSCAIGCL